jgi:hypothetical protein
MSPLSNEQKQLLFDYCMGLASETEAAEARQLISSSTEAAQIYSRLEATLAPLENSEPETCPDELVERTVLRLNNLARSSQLRLQQLLAAEQARTVSARSYLWRNIGKRLATAAVFMIVGGALITGLNIASRIARQKSWQQLCQMQLSNIWQGITSYSSDHDGKMPAVATASGEPWWKVGFQGKENHSNTRHMWLMVKGNYVDPAKFVCPGQRQTIVIQIDPSEIKNYSDFPDRGHVTYSFRITRSEPEMESTLSDRVLMSDLNPLFERLPPDYSNPLKLKLNRELLTSNSINHDRRGQNVLFGNGSVKFLKTRQLGITDDDIFTIQNTQVYQGCEVPVSKTDAFVAP